MRRKSFIFILAFLGIISAFWAIKKGMAPPPKTPLIVLPPQKPYPKGIAASGMIEALGENISIGSPENGIVQEIYIKVGQQVKKRDPLFRIDTRELESELRVAEAKEEVARADHHRIHDQLSRLLSIKDSRAISQEELHSKENEASVALATLTHMKREKEKIAGLVDRLIIRSPIDGMILQKNIKVGEYVLAANIDRPPIVMGDTSRLQIRADVDEQNASHIVHQAEAIAYPKNRPSYAIPLTFVRIEPYVIPKISLTGSSREKVDTRVLQVVYTFDSHQDISLYVGQQVDVYIKRDSEEML